MGQKLIDLKDFLHRVYRINKYTMNMERVRFLFPGIFSLMSMRIEDVLNFILMIVHN